jgi:RimJ/RimL family protein N-acetyltransferase
MKSNKTLITTPRLTMRRFETTDAAFVFELLNSPGWLQYIGSRDIYTLDDAENYIKNKLQISNTKTDATLMAVTLSSSNQLIGMCGFLERPEYKYIDLGFAFLDKYQGKGYAIEAAKACLAYAYEVYQVYKINAIVQEDNLKSIALLTQCGFQFFKIIKIDGEYLSLYQLETTEPTQAQQGL